MSKVSVVVPMYNVARWLPDFLASLDAQEGGLSGFELIFVDDGSPDDSARIVTAWNERTGAGARLVSKPNGGLSSARNAGMEVATGEWVTFWDPDDMLDPWYCNEMRALLETPEVTRVHLIIGRLVWFDEATGMRSEHPLDYRFKDGNRIVDLERTPDCIHLAANAALYRLAVLREHGLIFDHRVQPTFEDGHLTGRYLGKFERPTIALRADALYLYRRRADQTSLVQTGWSKESKYLAQPRYGWLDLLESVKADRGRVPHWAQHVVLYELQWYFKAGRQVPIRTAWITPAMQDEFHRTLASVVDLLDEDYIENFEFNAKWFALDLVMALMIGLKGRLQRPLQVTVDHLDQRRQVVRMRYYYGGDAPVEEFRVDGSLVTPLRTKTRRVDFLGRTMAWERTIWLPANEAAAVRLDGLPMPVRVGSVESTRYQAVPTKMWRTLARSAPPKPKGSGRSTATATAKAGGAGARRAIRVLRRVKEDPARAVMAGRKRAGKLTAKRLIGGKRQRRVLKGVARRLSRFEPMAAYSNAWLLMDKDTHANDNAEHLYRWLRTEQPEVNAWFVLNRGSCDWGRLEAEGFGLIPHGSRRHLLALLHCKHVISSHADHYVVRPLDGKGVGNGSWRFTFLQHGVTKDDLSTWLNPKPIDLVITATADETASIVTDGTAYRFGTHDVALTGFPRHDRLWRLGEATSVEARRKLLVMPTWRVNLLGERVGNSNARELRADFWETRYAASWRTVLESDRLRKAAATHGYAITFIPHPNMQEYLATSPLPDHIAVHRFDDVDVQQTIAEGAMLVTDYSSLAFEAAYLNRPIVYFQFDEAEFFSGSHVYTRGTWSYRDDGFGPVATEPDEALDAIVALLESECVPQPEYTRRMANTFGLRDGQCARRTFEAIAALDKPLKAKELYRRLDG